MKNSYTLALPLFFLPAFLVAMGVGAGCATMEHDLEAIASDPNVVSNVESLVQTAAGLLEKAIARAGSGSMKVLATDPNGVILERDIAAELRAVKDALDSVALPSKQ